MGGSATYDAVFRDNLTEVAQTLWEWHVKHPEYDPLALNRSPLQALEFAYNDRLGALIFTKNDKDFWLAEGPNGKGYKQITKEVTCYTE